MSTLSQLVVKTIERLSMVSGAGTQLYAEDAIAEMIQHKFDVLFDERFWPQFCSWRTSTLDGTIGVVTDDLTNVLKRYFDIQVIFRQGTNIRLTEFKSWQTNPNTFSGTTARFFEPYNDVTKVFRIIPVGATGQITYRLRTKPAAYTEEDEINFDDQALILGATYDYLEDDGTNPQATEKFRLLFESRVTQLKRMLSSQPSALDQYAQVIPSTWG